MPISIIAAVAKNRAIGKNNQIPWHISEDFKHFKKVTMGNPIIMGQKTFESIGKPLPGRENIVLTDDPSFKAEGVTIVYSLEEAIEKGGKDKELFITGGASVYKQTLPLADKLYLTLIDQDFEGDTFFPEFDLKNDFEIIEESEKFVSEKSKIPYRFIIAKKRKHD